MIRNQIQQTEEQSEPLKQLAACQWKTVDELVRLGVDQLISSKHKWQQLIEASQTIFVHSRSNSWTVPSHTSYRTLASCKNTQSSN